MHLFLLIILDSPIQFATGSDLPTAFVSQFPPFKDCIQTARTENLFATVSRRPGHLPKDQFAQAGNLASGTHQGKKKSQHMIIIRALAHTQTPASASLARGLIASQVISESRHRIHPLVIIWTTLRRQTEIWLPKSRLLHGKPHLPFEETMLFAGVPRTYV
jgi:hypothetical protein